MMAFSGAKERTAENWQSLVERAGMEIVGIWSLPGNHESVIEVVPVYKLASIPIYRVDLDIALCHARCSNL
jgi:hypothetical protein